MTTNFLEQFAGVQPGGAPALGASAGGSLAELGELTKALQASNFQTDVATLTGGGALGVQSLDTTMKTVVQENEHFVLFNQLQKTNATNIVDEYTRQSGVGGVLGGSTNTQMGVVRGATGEYSREIGLVKFLMSLRQVGYVLNLGRNISEPIAVEERNGALQLLTDAEYLLFNGNADASPTQYDGVIHQLDKEVAAGRMSGDNIVDVQGAGLKDVAAMSKIAVAIQSYGSWGRPTDIYMPPNVQQDLNMGLDPAFRWLPGNGNTPVVGAHVEGIRLQTGTLMTHMDTFMNSDTMPTNMPYQVTWPAQTAANAALTPVAVAGATASLVSSQFTASRAGNYYYAVASIDPSGAGQSPVLVSAQVAVGAGDGVTITITGSAAANESGYAIYRSRQNGTNAPNDLRLVATVPVTPGGTTVWVDDNRNIPGSSQAVMLNMGQGSDAIGWRQFNSMTKIPLPFGVGGVAVYSWFQFLFGYLRVTKPKHHGYIKNIVTANQVWRPFTNE